MQLGWLAHKRIPHTHAHTHTHDERLNPLTNAREHRRTMYAHATSVCCASSDEERAFGCTRVQAHTHDTHQCSLSETNTHDANATKTHTHTSSCPYRTTTAATFANASRVCVLATDSGADGFIHAPANFA